MSKYEYKVVTCFNWGDAEVELNKYGKEGYRLTRVAIYEEVIGPIGLFMKRDIKEK